MPSWKKVVVSGSDATLNSLFVSTAVTASVFSGSSHIGSHTGSLLGTASLASTASLSILSNFLSIGIDNNYPVALGGVTTATPASLSSYSNLTFNPSQNKLVITGSLHLTGSLGVTGNTIINTQQNTDVDIGTEVVATIPTSSMYGAFFDYTVTDLTNYRAGTVMAVWNTVGSVQYTDNSTPDIGDTSGVTLAVVANGSNVELRATVTTNNWNIKTFVRSI